MLAAQSRWTATDGWKDIRSAQTIAPQLVLVFGSRALLSREELLGEVAAKYPGAALVGCSTAGEILSDRVADDSLSITAIEFARTTVHVASVEVASADASLEAGRSLAALLPNEDLSHVLLFAEGVHCDGAALIQGLHEVLGAAISITGGMAGDQEHYQHTVLLAHGEVLDRRVVAVGLYGSAIRVGYGTLGGWDAYGPSRLVTRSQRCVVHELDGERALDVYRRYLGELGANLPANALRFPLSMRHQLRGTEVMRTVCGIDEAAGSLTFAGAVPQGSQLRMMKANVERLIDAATGAAALSATHMGDTNTEFALLVSCIGRKLLLRAHADEEVECVRGILGPRTALAGFYSYGEIAPLSPGTESELHNQTLTITTFSES